MWCRTASSYPKKLGDRSTINRGKVICQLPLVCHGRKEDWRKSQKLKTLSSCQAWYKSLKSLNPFLKKLFRYNFLFLTFLDFTLKPIRVSFVCKYFALKSYYTFPTHVLRDNKGSSELNKLGRILFSKLQEKVLHFRLWRFDKAHAQSRKW